MSYIRSDRDVTSRSNDWAITRVDVTDDLLQQLTLPRPDRPLETALHDADRRALDAASSTLEAAFPSLPIRHSTQATDATTLVVGSAGQHLLDALDVEASLDCILRRNTFQPGAQIRLVRDKVTRSLDDIVQLRPGGYPDGHIRVKPAPLAAALDDGFTVVLDGIDLRDPISTTLAGLFERAFGCVVNINAYLSSSVDPSFGAHWDDQEVVILQLIGRKDWTIEQPAGLSMHKVAHGEATSGQVAWHGRVRAGDAMYIPRGWGHTVNGIGELTYHYTITIPRVNGLQLLESVLGQLAMSVDATAGETVSPVMLGAAPSHEDWDGVVANLGLPVDPATVDDLVRCALARVRFGIPRRSTGSVKATLDAMLAADLAGTMVRSVNPGGWVVVTGSTSEVDADERVIIGTAGQLASLPHHLLDTVAGLTDGRVHDAGSAPPGVVHDLLRIGFLEVVTDPKAWGLTLA